MIRTMIPICMAVAAAVLTAQLPEASALVTYVEMGFEVNEGNDVGGNPVWGADGTPAHGRDLPFPTLPAQAAFSIPDENNRWLVDNSNARTGSQSVRLTQSVPFNYYFNLNDEARTNLNTSTELVRITYSVYRAQTGDDLRMNGGAQPNPTNPTNLQGEMWQLRIAPDGNISAETGGGTFAYNPGDLTGWYDFEIDIDVPAKMIHGARWREPGATGFTELITGSPVAFKPDGNPYTLGVLVFRPDNAGVSPDTAWDDIRIFEISDAASGTLFHQH